MRARANTRITWVYLIVATAVAAVVMGVVQAGDGGSSQSRAQAPVASTEVPAFSSLDRARAAVTPEVREALSEAGAFAGADTSVVAFDGGTTATVARTPGHYFLAVERDGQVRALVDTPVANLERHLGTYVTATQDGTTTAAILVPDGVASLTTTDESGVRSDIAVTSGLAVVTKPGRFAASFELNGKTVEVFPVQPSPPKLPQP